MLKMKVNLMEEKDKNCGLIIDEMAIQPKYEFNSTTQSFMGRPTLPPTQAVLQKRAFDPYWKREHDLAHHGFNIIAVGIGLRWKSFVAYHFTDTSFDPEITAQWIIQVIRRLMDIGLKVRFQTFDSSTMNVALQAVFEVGVTGKANCPVISNIAQICNEDEAIVPDAAHEIKSIRKHSLKYELIIEESFVELHNLPTNIVKLKEILVDIIQFQANMEKKIAPHLSMDMLELGNYDAMRVLPAKAVLSLETAGAIR